MDPQVQSAYKKINVSDAERAQITRLLAAVIMLGEIQVRGWGGRATQGHL